MCHRQYLLMLFLASTMALNPPCCSRNENIIEVIDKNDTLIVCDTSSPNNSLSLSCPIGSYRIPIIMDEIKTSFEKDDSLLLDISGEEMKVDNGSYCFSELQETNTDTKTPYVIICGFEETPDPYAEALSICMLVSAFFYLLTALIYHFLPPLRDLLGKCIALFCGTMSIGLLAISVMNLVPYTEWDLEHGYCAARGFFAYFVIVAAFFWSNVISIQTLRSLKKPTSYNKDCKIFCWYSVYAFGVPLILTSIMAGVNFYPTDHAKPGIGLNTCWFINSKQKWYYLYSVMTVLILANTGIFIHVSIVLWRSAHFKSDHARDVRYKFSLTLKLCIIMGLPWMIEMITSSISEGNIIGFILDAVNVLQGFLIFLVLVVLRKRTLRAMHSRGWFLCFSDAVSNYLNKSNDAEAQIVAQTDIQDLTVIDK